MIKQIAREYDEHYKGSHSWQEMENDFMIVAMASVHGIDLVVSNDEKTMTNRHALQAYAVVNEKLQFRNPKFIKFEEFKRYL